MTETLQKDKPTGKGNIVTPSISSRLTRLTLIIPKKKVRARLKKENKERIKEEKERRRKMTDTAAQAAAVAAAAKSA